MNTRAHWRKSTHSGVVEDNCVEIANMGAPIALPVRAHEMGIYKRYFDLIATGRKTTEIRGNDSSRKRIKEGSLIRFRCEGDQILTRVTRVARYASFEEMLERRAMPLVFGPGV
ncbi:MAG: ASCH domain-containing protein [Spirillospora sp.]